MKVPPIVKDLDQILPLYTDMLEVIRDSTVQFRVLKKFSKDVDQDHPVIRSVIYGDLVSHFSGTIVIAIMDLSIIIKNLISTKNKWERAYYLRQGMLLIYESQNVYNKHMSLISPTLRSKFPDIYKLYAAKSRKIREFKKVYKYNSHILKLRNNTIGHITDNIFLYCYMLSQIKPGLSKKCMIEYLEFLLEMERMQSEISNSLINKVLALEGETIDKYMKGPFQRLKFPKMLK